MMSIFSPKKVKTLTVAVALAAMFASSVYAGDMVIESGTTFSESFEKDGRRVEVTKTYTEDGVQIHQKIYDASTGRLIGEKNRTNPIKPHVKIVEQGVSVDSLREGDLIKPEVPKDAGTNAEQEKPVEKAPATDESKEETGILNKTEEELEEERLIEEVGPEKSVEEVAKMHNISQVDRVLVGAENTSEMQIYGSKLGRLMGLYPVEIPVDVIVDTNTGEIIEEKQSLLAKLLNFLSVE